MGGGRGEVKKSAVGEWLQVNWSGADKGNRGPGGNSNFKRGGKRSGTENKMRKRRSARLKRKREEKLPTTTPDTKKSLGPKLSSKPETGKKHQDFLYLDRGTLKNHQKGREPCSIWSNGRRK